MSLLATLHPLIVQGQKQALTRALTFIENEPFDLLEFFRLFQPCTGRARRIALTGPPGVGKSTLVAFLLETLRKEGKTVGVLAVDPSSVVHSGALLGDRIRMQNLALDEGVYIRSMATRGALGGIAHHTFDAADLLDASGKDYILIETVGIGQQEVEVRDGVDLVLLILSPEAGDSIQAMKSGIIEVCHIIGVNKADRPGVDLFLKDLEDILSLRNQYLPSSPETGKSVLPPILKLSAKTGEGLDSLYQTLQSLLSSRHTSPTDRKKQRVALLKKRLLAFLQRLLMESLHTHPAFQQRMEEISTQLYEDQLPVDFSSATLIQELFQHLAPPTTA